MAVHIMVVRTMADHIMAVRKLVVQVMADRKLVVHKLVIRKIKEVLMLELFINHNLDNSQNYHKSNNDEILLPHGIIYRIAYI